MGSGAFRPYIHVTVHEPVTLVRLIYIDPCSLGLTPAVLHVNKLIGQ